jgi:hypothetical protein
VVGIYLVTTGTVPFGSFIVFIILYLAVVRNERIKHFIRFNVLQAIILDIALILIGLGFDILSVGLPSFVLGVLNSTVFLGAIAAIGYSIVQSLRGLYAEIPVISEAVYYNLRY